MQVIRFLEDIRNVILIGCMCTLQMLSADAQKLESSKLLHSNTFQQPSKQHYPETWFHFIGGNVSKEGVTADLEAIAKAKISGIQFFHGQFGGPWPGVDKQIETLSEDWDDLIAWTAQECKRLGLSFTMQNCPGWSYAGGPWIEPFNAMRHLTSSKIHIRGRGKLHIPLSRPADSKEDWRDYQDLFVITFPTPLGGGSKRLLPVDVKTNQKNIDIKSCLLEDKKAVLSPYNGTPTTIDIIFDKDTTIRTVEFPSVRSFSRPWAYNPGVELTIYAKKTEDYEKIAHMVAPPSNWQDDRSLSLACKEVSSREYRIEIKNQRQIELSYIHLYTQARQHNWESEAGWTLRGIARGEKPVQNDATWIDNGRLLDISHYMDEKGILNWEAPVGDWTIMRIGHVNTGQKNGPAPIEATGWEANKLDVRGVRANYQGYIGRLLESGVLNNQSLQGVLVDSWECHTQTWTSELDQFFQDKWQYDLLPMMPALFGYVVNDPVFTSKFLRDWRVTLNSLLVDNFFGELSRLAHKDGLKVSFETASGDVFPGDILEYYKYADVPMCEFWQPKGDSHVGSIEYKPIKPTVSAARIYGKPRIAAESFTSFELTWNEHPRFLKKYADHAFSQGVTHVVFHTYTHNPRTDFLPPGSSFGSSIGTPFLRLQTWWKDMPHFTDYLARCNYMLERGNAVSDVLMYLGDEQNHRPLQSLDFPQGYAYDYCNRDVLLNRLSVDKGEIVTPEGLRYKVLWLYDCERMLPETLEKIRYFLEQGVIVVGEPPLEIASLGGGKHAKDRFHLAVQGIWGQHNERKRKVGQGMVYRTEIHEALSQENIPLDFCATYRDIHWLHRADGSSDIYFVSNASEVAYNDNLSFRSEGYLEIWDPVNGEVYSKGDQYFDSQTEISFHMSAGTSFFVVFHRHKKQQTSGAKKFPNPDSASQKEIHGLWEISFSKISNSGFVTRTETLVPWKNLDLSEEGKSFSGTAKYKISFDLEKENNGCYMLDLGRVEMIAAVFVNGEYVDTKWTYPYEVDVTRHLRNGSNSLEVSVTSTWHNRLVYDAGLPENERKTWTINGPKNEADLKGYGLFGPVKLRMDNDNE